MAAKDDEESSRDTQQNDCVFEWDDQSQLYFHASSGFYHDPNAGWYYSSIDRSYYKFENGSYVPWDSDKRGEYDATQQSSKVSDEAIEEDPCPKFLNDDDPENSRPPSEWLEETLIDLYLSGYSNPITNDAMPTKADVECDSKLPVHGAESDSTREIEEGEWIEEDLQDATESVERVPNEGFSCEEENWLAQYGQVVQSEEESVPASSIIDLWDWRIVRENIVKIKRGKKKKHQSARLIGKLVKPSAKLHPSMPSGGRILKTAAICEVNLALIRVSSGQLYRLKSPSLKYLSSISAYDSSNPTKDWGFPDLSIEKQDNHLPKTGESCDDEIPAAPESSSLPDQPVVTEKNKALAYRDRAAERRALHGGFGVGPGQKIPGRETSPEYDTTEEAAAEALHMSFGAGSYARKVLENMGWKEGEGLGKSTKGLLQPLEAVGNKGFAGLGWNHR